MCIMKNTTNENSCVSVLNIISYCQRPNTVTITFNVIVIRVSSLDGPTEQLGEFDKTNDSSRPLLVGPLSGRLGQF